MGCGWSRRFFAPGMALLLAGACTAPGARTPVDSGQPADARVTAIDPAALLPARVRRLTNAELGATVAALFGGAPDFARDLAPEERQSGFTANADQRVDPVYAAQLQDAARTLAKVAAPALVAGLGCADGEDCARRFLTGFLPRALRRPASEAELADLLAVFRAGTSDGSFTDGITLVLEAVLQSASFLHLTELGDGVPRDGVVTLAPHEIAASLSYLVTGCPPDAALVAATPRLRDRAARVAEARRLLATPPAAAQLERFVAEWLGLDQLDSTGKDPGLYGVFDDLRPLFDAETGAFLKEAIGHDQGTLATLLNADYTVLRPELRWFYNLPAADTETRASLAGTPRRGLLTQGRFLAVYAHPAETAPVRRGAAVLRRILCVDLPPPVLSGVVVTAPRPDPARTTRARFEQHVRDPLCAGCHARIDPFGFAFEAFDAIGGLRGDENGLPIDTHGQLDAADVSGAVADAAALTSKLAASAEAQRCFARNLARAAAAAASEPLEEAFVREAEALPPARRAGIVDLLVTWVGSDLFVDRRVAP
jgi:hypothetical protein